MPVTVGYCCVEAVQYPNIMGMFNQGPDKGVPSWMADEQLHGQSNIGTVALGPSVSQFPGQPVSGLFDQMVENGGDDDSQPTEGQRNEEVAWFTTENIYPGQPTYL